MRIDWGIAPEDIKRVKDFYNAIKNDKEHGKYVQDRIKRNIERKKGPYISKQRVWYVLVGCLLTTQQRSGQQGTVSRFISQRPFPLAYKTCLSKRNNVEKYSRQTLSDFQGIRFTNKIPLQISKNLTLLEEEGLWADILTELKKLRQKTTRGKEREVADYINDNFHGFGPKQSRNFLQWLGLTRYEIPIDSRVVKWLKDFGFPGALSANALSDKDYYHFVSDGIQELCRASDIYPCAFDAAIFISLDGKSRKKSNVRS